MAKGKYRVGVIKGDGIGPEIVSAALEVVSSLEVPLEFVNLEAGYEYYKRSGKPFEEGLLDRIRELDAVIKGPLYTPPQDRSFRSVNVLLRRELNLYANIRPFKSFKGISLKSFDFVIVRENVEDLYVGIEGSYEGFATALKVVTERGSRRIADLAFRYAKAWGRRRVTAVHKANILKVTDGLFLESFYKLAKEHPDLVADDLIVDTAAYTMVKSPESLQVLVTLNLYGDILSDVAAALVGSLGLCGSAQIGEVAAIFEPVHGVALDIAGRGIANPIGEITAAKLMLEYLATKHEDYSLQQKAKILDGAIRVAVEEWRVLTPDLGGPYKTADVVEALKKAIQLLREG